MNDNPNKTGHRANSGIATPPPYAEPPAEEPQARQGADELKRQGEAVADRAAGGVDSAKQQGRDQARKLRRKASEVQAKAVERSQEARRYVESKARERVRQQQQTVAAGLRDAAEAVRSAGQTLRERDDSSVAKHVDSVAEKLSGVAGYLQEHEPGELLDDGRAMARRHPELFLGGMFVVGLAAARFLKSSETRRDQEAGDGRRETSSRSRSADDPRPPISCPMNDPVVPAQGDPSGSPS